LWSLGRGPNCPFYLSTEAIRGVFPLSTCGAAPSRCVFPFPEIPFINEISLLLRRIMRHTPLECNCFAAFFPPIPSLTSGGSLPLRPSWLLIALNFARNWTFGHRRFLPFHWVPGWVRLRFHASKTGGRLVCVCRGVLLVTFYPACINPRRIEHPFTVPTPLGSPL